MKLPFEETLLKLYNSKKYDNEIVKKTIRGIIISVPIIILSLLFFIILNTRSCNNGKSEKTSNGLPIDDKQVEILDAEIDKLLKVDSVRNNAILAKDSIIQANDSILNERILEIQSLKQEIDNERKQGISNEGKIQELRSRVNNLKLFKDSINNIVLVKNQKRITELEDSVKMLREIVVTSNTTTTTPFNPNKENELLAKISELDSTNAKLKRQIILLSNENIESKIKKFMQQIEGDNHIKLIELTPNGEDIQIFRLDRKGKKDRVRAIGEKLYDKYRFEYKKALCPLKDAYLLSKSNKDIQLKEIKEKVEEKMKIYYILAEKSGVLRGRQPERVFKNTDEFLRQLPCN